MKCSGANGTKSSFRASWRWISSRCSCAMPSHLLTAMISARPRSSAMPSTLASCSATLSCASSTMMTTCASSIACSVLATLARSIASSTLARRRTPAVSMSMKLAAVALEGHEDAVARRARLLARDHALLAQQPVDQRRLADVGAADDRDADGVDSFRLLRDCGSKPASTCSMSSSQPWPCAGGRSRAARRSPAHGNPRRRCPHRALRPC